MAASIIDEKILALAKHVSVRRIMNIKASLNQFSDFAKFKSCKLVTNIIRPGANQVADLSSQLFCYEGLVSTR